MDEVYIYFHNNQIYNLDDMSVLGIFPKGNQMTLYQHLEAIKQKYNIKLVIMDFNQPFRNAIYCLFPDSDIVIHPIYVAEMINSYLPWDLPITGIGEEIAAGIEGQVIIKELQMSCQGIYMNNTKKEAINYYREWQSYIPLGIKCFYNVIRTIDFYHEEVFNYFVFKDTVNQISL